MSVLHLSRIVVHFFKELMVQHGVDNAPDILFLTISDPPDSTSGVYTTFNIAEAGDGMPPTATRWIQVKAPPRPYL